MCQWNKVAKGAVSDSEGKVMITVWDVSAKAKTLARRHQVSFVVWPFCSQLNPKGHKGLGFCRGG